MNFGLHFGRLLCPREVSGRSFGSSKIHRRKSSEKESFFRYLLYPRPPETMDYMWEGYKKLENRTFAKMLENMSRKVSEMSSQILPKST